MGFINWDYFKEVKEKRKHEDNELIVITKGEKRIGVVSDLLYMATMLLFGLSIGSLIAISSSQEALVAAGIIYYLIGLSLLFSGIILSSILKQFKLRRREN